MEFYVEEIRADPERLAAHLANGASTPGHGVYRLNSWNFARECDQDPEDYPVVWVVWEKIHTKNKIRTKNVKDRTVHRVGYHDPSRTECGKPHQSVKCGSEAKTTCEKCLAVLRKRRAKWMKTHPNGSGLGRQTKMP